MFFTVILDGQHRAPGSPSTLTGVAGRADTGLPELITTNWGRCLVPSTHTWWTEPARRLMVRPPGRRLDVTWWKPDRRSYQQAVTDQPAVRTAVNPSLAI